MSALSFWLSVLMLVAGAGIPIMAAMNAGLGVRIDHPVAATVVLFLGALIVSGVGLVIIGPPTRAAFFDAPPYLYVAGALNVLYVLSITWSAPKIGLGNAVFLVLLGQLVSAATIDHFGLFGAPQTSVSARRVAGLVLMAVGIALARRPG